MRPVMILGMLLTCAACVASARAQEPPPPQPNLLLQMTRPQQQAIGVESSMRDDIQSRPASSRTDPLGDNFRLYVGVGDPRCNPAEDGLIPDRLSNRRRLR
jgi:hypothetical protein